MFYFLRLVILGKEEDPDGEDDDFDPDEAIPETDEGDS